MQIAAMQAPLAGMTIYPSQKAQISAFIQDETPTKISPKYANYTNIFFLNLTIELPKNTGINKHVIKLEKDKQLFYWPIYNLQLMKLETLKTYIKTHLKTGCI